jgi:NADH-quinone oxidoreductase subunit E
MPEFDEKTVLSIMAGYDDDPQQLIAVLLDIQEASGRNFIPKDSLRLVSRVLRVPLARIYEVITFYEMFSLCPRGRRLVEICDSPPCAFNGAEELMGCFREALGIGEGETTEDGLFTLKRAGCFGFCEKAPSVRIGSYRSGGLSLEEVLSLIRREREELLFKDGKEDGTGESGTFMPEPNDE